MECPMTVTGMQEHALLSAIIEASDDAILSKTLDGIITRWNRGAERMFGYTAAEIIGQPKTILFPKDRLGEEEIFLDRIRQGLKTDHFETIRLRKDSSPLRVSVTILPSKDERGQVDGATTIVRDITGRQHLLDVFRDKQQRLQVALKAGNISIWELDLAQQILYCSEETVCLFGMRPEIKELSVSEFMLRVHPDDRVCVRREFLSALPTQTSFELIFRILRSGEVRWIQANGHVLSYKEGQPLRYTGTFRDITDQKQAENSLKQQAQIIEQVHDALIRMDMEGVVTLWNRGAERIFGYTAEEALGRLIFFLFFEEDLPQIQHEVFTPALQDGQHACELRARHKSGRAIYITLSLSLLMDSHQTAYGMIGVSSDITQRKLDEEALAEAIEELERRNQESAQARDAALAAAHAKSQFLANMSHEIRTPLNGVVGIAEVLSFTSLDANQQSYLRTIRQSAQNLLGIINDILDFSKIECGKITLETIPFTLRDVLEDSAALLATKAHEKGLEVCCLFPPMGIPKSGADALLLGDPTRLTQIITNLLSNAIKFTEKGEIILGAELMWTTPYESQWRVFVRDTGIGIPAARQEAIFESFIQADGSTTRRFGGTGLGLTISRQLARLMGGQINLQSEVGKGSEFQVECAFMQQATPETPSSSELPSMLNCRTLIIDDNRVCRQALQALLTAWGCSVTAVEHGTEALEIVQQQIAQETPPDLILLDMLLLQEEGNRLEEQLKQIPQLAEAPIVPLCSIGAPGVAEAMSNPAFFASLCKPVRQIELWNLLQRLRSKQDSVSLFPEPDLFFDVPEEQPSHRILLAEDVAVNQIVACELLKQCGIPRERITIVPDGCKALEALEQETFDLILMDVQMPEMNGWEAVAAIREREQKLGGYRVPVIALTAHALAGDREACLSAGMDDYLSKPLELKALSAILQKWLPVSCLSPTSHSNQVADSAPVAEEEVDISLLNNSRLEAVTAGCKDLESALLHEYLSSVPKMLVRCELAVENGDAQGLEHWAHTMKGSSRTIGADLFAELCQDLEALGKQNKIPQAEERLPFLQGEWKRLEDHIRRRI